MTDQSLPRDLERLHRASYGWALCCCGHDRDRAEEALQRAYLKVLEGAARFDGRGSFKTWLFAVIRRTAADDRRRDLLQRLRLFRYAAAAAAAPAAAFEEAEPGQSQRQRRLRDVFVAALARLPARQREVLHLVFYQEMTVAEAAAVMGVSIGSARTHYARGKAKMRSDLVLESGDEPRPRRSGITRAV